MKRILAFMASAVAMIVLSQPVFSEGRTRAHQKGDFSILLSTSGHGEIAGKGIKAFQSDNDFYQFKSEMNLLSTNPERQNYGLMQQSTDTEIQASSRISRLGFEYATADWFGIGIALSQATFTIKNYYAPPDFSVFLLSSMFTLPGAGAANPFCALLPCLNSPPDVLEMLVNTPVEMKSYPANTLDLHFSFHFLQSQHLDPFLRIEGGVGNVNGSAVTKGGAALGTRYVFDSGLFISGEVAQDHYVLAPSKGERTSSDPVIFNTANVGVGWSF